MHRVKYLIAVILAGLIFYGAAGLAQVMGQLNQAELTLAQLRQTDQRLSQSIQELQSDMSDGAFQQSAERIAREKLGLIMPGETVFYGAGN